MDVHTLPGVFTPHSDSWALADAVSREPSIDGAHVLDVCTGSGVVALAAALAGARVTAIDLFERAIENVELNCSRAGVPVRALRGDLFAPVAGERFDIIASNPPYVPSVNDELPRGGPERAWAAGRDGRRVLDVLVAQALDHLAPGGALLLIHSALIGEQPTLDRLLRSGFVRADVVERRRGPLGPLMREQQRLGTISPTITEEEVVIVRAVAPTSRVPAPREGLSSSTAGKGPVP